MRTRLLLLLAMAAPSCAPRMFVNVLQPAPVNFGAAKKIALVEAQGRRSAREAIIQDLIRQARSTGYFTVADRSEEGITVKIAGRTVEVSGGKAPPPGPDEIGLRIDVIDWNAEKEARTTKDSKGKETTAQVWIGKVLLSVTAFNGAGKALLAEKEYKAKREDPVDEDKAILSAAREVISNVLDDITPTYVQKAIRLDDDLEEQKPIIEIARNGNVPQAIDQERQLIAKNPKNGPATYNLAVLLDSQGLYKEALPLYDQAIQLSPKEYYGEMKAECARRLADAEALAN